MEHPVAKAVAQEPPPAPPHQMLQCQGGWLGWARCAVVLALLLAVTGSFAGAVYRTRHSSRDLAFVLVAYYLLAVLLCCVAKLELLRHDPAAGEVQKRRVRLAVWAFSVALGTIISSRVADAMPVLVLKLAVWGVTAVVIGLAFYLFFRRKDAESCGAEHGCHGKAAAGRQPEKALRELSPEEKV